MVMDDIPNNIRLVGNAVFLDTLLIVNREKIFTFILLFFLKASFMPSVF
jgi:hypothetical protein